MNEEGLPNIWGNAQIFSYIQYEEAVHIWLCNCSFRISSYMRKILFLMYFQKWNCATSFSTSTFMYLWAIYIYIPMLLLSPPIFLQQNRRTNRGNIHINSSQMECRNWERGRAVSFLGVFFSHFQYSVFAVQGPIDWNQAWQAASGSPC